MGSTAQRVVGTILTRTGLVFFYLLCGFYATYAFAMGGWELLSLWGLTKDAPERAVPIVFVIHAISGGIALLCGPVQFHGFVRAKIPALHRFVGRAYVFAIWMSSLAGLWSALFFHVDIAAKVSFVALSLLWSSTTTAAYYLVRKGRVEAHREWMVRSFSLSLFFITFSVWVPGMASTGLPTEVSYPLAVFLSWAVNLVVAETGIRLSRRQRIASQNAQSD